MKIDESVTVDTVMQTSSGGSLAPGKRVVVAPPHYTLRQAEELFLEHDVHHLPIVDDAGRLIGIVTARDVLRAYARSDDLSPKELVLANMMTKSPRSVRPSETLRAAVLALARAPFQSLVVVDVEGRPIGILTTRDVVAFLGDEYTKKPSSLWPKRS